jgi:hypothetical protein
MCSPWISPATGLVLAGSSQLRHRGDVEQGLVSLPILLMTQFAMLGGAIGIFLSWDGGVDSDGGEKGAMGASPKKFRCSSLPMAPRRDAGFHHL